MESRDMNEVYASFVGEYSQHAKQNVRTISVGEKWPIDFCNFLDFFQGQTFSRGVYRVVLPENVLSWRGLIANAFPDFSGDFLPFGFDWLGRFFCLSLSANDSLILLFSPFSDEVLEIPSGIESFHNEVLVGQANAALEVSLFNDFLTKNKINCLGHEDCAGLSVPLFLGGAFSLEAMQIIGLKFYWEILAQMLKESSGLLEGTPISSIRLRLPT